MTAHTDKKYEEELRQLKQTILSMGSLAEEMIALSMKALIQRDNEAAETTIEKDHEVNELEMKIDEQCLQLLALRQPAASDLRFITIGLRASKDLERIGDLAVNIAQESRDLNKEPQLKPYSDLPKMAERTQSMVKSALDAFVKQDVDLAGRVCEMDDEVDNYNDLIFLELVRLMQKDVATVSRGTRLILVCRQLERIADHATNIAEEVIFMIQGKDIRHGRATK